MPHSARLLLRGPLALDSYQHVVRSNEAEAGHPQISQIAQIQPVSIDGLAIRPPENLRNLRISLPSFLLPRSGPFSQAKRAKSLGTRD